MQIEFTRQPDSLQTEMLHKWLSAPQATLEMLRAIEHGAELAPLSPPSLPQLLQPCLVSGRHIRWGPVEGMVHAHMDLCDTGKCPQAQARVVDKRCAHQASGLCHPDHDADARSPGL